ncbi:hypothetical protein REPUB_Repub05bG0181600 [Reevesia pubescens]
MNEPKFFAITNHSLTLVAQDASYVRRFTSDYIFVNPGQTMDVLVSANQNVGQYYMATRPFSDASFTSIDFITIGIFEYTASEGGLNASLITLPARNNTNATNNFVSQIRNANVTQNPPLNVPTDIDRRVYVAIATNNMPCNTSKCLVTSRFVASMNNVSFQFPRIDILQAYYNMNINGVFTEDFPLDPLVFYDFTGNLTNLNPRVELGTRAVMLNYGEAVEIVLIASELVGTGFGNFNNVIDPTTYNLVDPPLINTIHVSSRGWVALRFFATNPGKVWFMHCHLERHSSWDMETVIIVRNGTTVETSIHPPPPGMPCCLGA